MDIKKNTLSVNRRGVASGLRWALIAALFLLFFIGGPDAGDGRVLRAIWNLGHPLFFAVLTLSVLRWPAIVARSFATRALLALGSSVLVGGGIEWVQSVLGREADYRDILGDVLGAVLGLLAHQLTHHVTSKAQRRGVGLLLTGFLLLALLPTVIIIWDEGRARWEMPQLADFEYAGQLSRWSGTDHLLSDQFAADGSSSLRVRFGTQGYSTLRLDHLPRDWSAYDSLHFSIYNPDSEVLELVYRIHDRQHLLRGLELEDRFNRRMQIKPGWNVIVTPLQAIVGAPRERALDLRNVHGLMLFTIQLERPRIIYLDSVRLK